VTAPLPEHYLLLTVGVRREGGDEGR
jgi:hypothetical protein